MIFDSFLRRNMPNSSTTVGGSRRGGPTFKFYWVENGKIVSIKRYDEADTTVVPYRVFKLIAFVFPHFKVGKHVVKFQDDSDLIELTEEDCVRFNAESGDMQVYLYIFSSKEEASRTVTPPTNIPQPSQLVPQNTSTQVTFPKPMVTIHQEEISPQPQVTVPQPQVTVPQPHIEATQQSHQATQAQSNPQDNSSTDQCPHQEDGDLEEHLNVVCDGCEGRISGHRYKCLQCRDFDLCQKCEANGQHPKHLMMRLPLHWVNTSGFSKRQVLRSVVNAAARVLPDDYSEVVIDLGHQFKDLLKSFGVDMEYIGEEKPSDGRRKFKGKHCPFAGFADKRCDSKHHSFRKCHRRDAREEARANQDMQTQSEPSPPRPFAPSTSAPTTTTSTPAPSAPSAPTLIPNPAHVPDPAPSATAPSAPSTPESGGPIHLLDNSDVIPMEEDSPRAHPTGEWLMVDNNDGAAAVTAERPTGNQEQFESGLPFLHCDDIANVALEKLALMGYKIDDPLLVHLVEDCKGDITRILDCLHG